MLMEAGANGGDEEVVDLPPGFRFHPTDEEIITHYLTKKVFNDLFAPWAIGEADLNKCEPWDLPKRAKMGEKEWYFFFQKDRKYPTGMRTNRATESGYWKATGKDKEIFQGKDCLVGMKKTLVFYKGRAPKGEKSNWVMHEFRLDGKLAYYHFSKPSKNEWVVCRVFHKNTGIRKNPIFPAGDSPSDSVLPLTKPSIYNSGPSPSFMHAEDDHDRDAGVGNQYHFPSGKAVDANFSGNIPNDFDTVFTNPLFPKYQYPSNSPLLSYMRGQQDSDYFVGYQGTTNEHHRAIIRGPAADTSIKAEQLSSMVNTSQDTAVSADTNGKITASSTVSGYQHHKSGFYADEDPEWPSVDPISDILKY